MVLKLDDWRRAGEEEGPSDQTERTGQTRPGQIKTESMWWVGGRWEGGREKVSISRTEEPEHRGTFGGLECVS